MLLLLLACQPGSNRDPVDLLGAVDLFVGTGGDGFGYGGLTPAATAPNGLVKVGPDTSSGTRAGFNHSAGYWYDDTHVEGFSHYRLPGIGVGDGGAVRVMMAGASTLDREVYRAPYDHETEEASPGYYRLEMADRGQAELTATLRAAHHRYEWTSDEHWLLFDLREAGSSEVEILDAWVEIDPDYREISGFVELAGSLTGRGGDEDNPAGLPIWFAARTSELWEDAELSTRDGSELPDGLSLRFGGDVELQLGLSIVDLDGARANLEQELPDWDFEQTRMDTERQWSEALSPIEVWGGTEQEQVIFASALFHTRMMPTLFTDVDGRFRGLDVEIDQARDWSYYSDFSMWDTYRTLHPYVILVWPELAADLARSLTDMGAKRGGFPRWPAGVVESGSMLGNSAEIVLGESFIKGIEGWDHDLAWDIAIGQAQDPDSEMARPELEYYLDYGYVPVDLAGSSTAKTLEYAIADGAMARWADASWRRQRSEVLWEASLSYAPVFNPETGFMQGLSSEGEWSELKLEGWDDDAYTEGNAWQYAWLAPHDPEGLAALHGSTEDFLALLTEMFELSVPEEDTAWPDPYYWHGNEPDIHASALFAAVGAGAEGDVWIDWIRNRHYAASPSGLDGNDDGGTLSAWYTFTAMGLYPLNGTADYVLVDPVFDKVKLHRPEGTLEIRVEGDGDVVRRITLDGETLLSRRVNHSELVGEHTLIFWK